MREKVIICDLDNTIFDTSSIESEIFTPLLQRSTSLLAKYFDMETVRSIMRDIMSSPFDRVCRKYSLDKSLILPVLSDLNGISLEHSSIAPYDDYSFFRMIPSCKILVTTGFARLQEEKINKLQIREDFDMIIINDPAYENLTKIDIFRKLIIDLNLKDKHTYVVGDDPDSEIMAGKVLGLTTVLISRNEHMDNGYSDYAIPSFKNLNGIMYGKSI